ncbi:MAG: PD40 domain-containing protein, partial [Acidobacteria bacterium]|nr:PD40 domain-containing protein [Acidobacteriota bacterium]
MRRTGFIAVGLGALVCTVVPGELLCGAALGGPPPRAVFAGQSQGGTWDIWLAGEDGRAIRPALRTADQDERTPVLSPNRKFVAFSTSRGQIGLYNTYDGVTRTLQLASAGRPAWPAWSPDGESLYYVDVLMGKGPDEGRVWRYDLRGGKGEPVADEPEVEGWPAVSPDGVLLFTTWTQSQTCHLSTLKPGSAQPRLAWDRSLTLSGATHLPGGRIAAIGSDQQGQKVVLLTADGKLLREHRVPGASGRPVAYREGLLLTRIDGGTASLHVLDMTSGKTRPW